MSLLLSSSEIQQKIYITKHKVISGRTLNKLNEFFNAVVMYKYNLGNERAEKFRYDGWLQPPGSTFLLDLICLHLSEI